MNKDNAKDYLPLVQALADGKVIQLHNGVSDWQDINGSVDFLMPPVNYRIKSEPLVIYASMQSDLQKIYSVSNNRLNVIPSPFDGKVRKFVEVIED